MSYLEDHYIDVLPEGPLHQCLTWRTITSMSYLEDHYIDVLPGGPLHRCPTWRTITLMSYLEDHYIDVLPGGPLHRCPTWRTIILRRSLSFFSSIICCFCCFMCSLRIFLTSFSTPFFAFSCARSSSWCLRSTSANSCSEKV